MNTEHFIRILASDTKPSRRTERILLILLPLSALMFGGLFLVKMGVRSDFPAALMHANILIKNTFPWVLAAGALGVVLRMARPGAPVGRWPLLIGAVLAVLAGAFAVTMANTPPGQWGMAMLGKSRFVCTTSIPLISIPVLAASLWALRQGAPVRPTLCGAVAGFMAGSASAGMYAFFCTDDSPMYFAIWYLIAILIVTVAGALIGSRVLRW